MIRSAGASAQLFAREAVYALMRMRSGEIRRVLSTCRAVSVKYLTPNIIYVP